MSIDRAPPARWPACALAVVFLGYAAGKAVFAAQGRLGFPGGAPVPAAEYARYTREVIGVATAQWLATATGVAGAVLVLATVTRPGRRLPRPLMLVLLGLVLLGVGAGAAILVLDGFIGLGVGWRWYHGILAIAVVGLLVATIRSYLRATRRTRDHPGTRAR